jgi:hypothetical protein
MLSPFFYYFKQKSFADMTMYCLDYKMKLIIFENRTEEEIVQKTWGTRKCQNRQFMIV